MKLRLTLVLAVFLLMGCIRGGTGMPVPIKHYALEYPPPRAEGKIAAEGAVRIERFILSQDYDSRDMVYRARPFLREAYRTHRWNVTPTAMVHGLILRDIRQSGLFDAVLSPEDDGRARYVLDGRIEEFLEIDEAERSVASVVISVTLFESAAPDRSEKILHQKTYRSTEPFSRHQPEELARAMSAAMARLSGELIGDLSSFVQKKERKK